MVVAFWGSLSLLGKDSHLDGACFFAAQGKVIVAHEDPHRVAQWGAIDDEDLRPGNDSHFHESESTASGGVHRDYASAYFCWEGVKCHMRFLPRRNESQFQFGNSRARGAGVEKRE